MYRAPRLSYRLYTQCAPKFLQLWQPKFLQLWHLWTCWQAWLSKTLLNCNLQSTLLCLCGIFLEAILLFARKRRAESNFACAWCVLNFPEKLSCDSLCEYFHIDYEHLLLGWPSKKVFMRFCTRWAPIFQKQTTLGGIFACIFRYFANIFIDFARIFRDFA